MNKLKIVLDTNILLVSISRKSEYHWIFDKFIKNEFYLCISNDILSEYEEIMSLKLPSALKQYVLDIIAVSESVLFTNNFYKWKFITSDPDDNKFVDCAITSNADYLVTNDSDFKIIKKIDFPKVHILNYKEFKELMVDVNKK
ncbi:MAG: putative toxin-antitoxin system toxin component, PIN family [Spirochaetes bacterium RIFOXYB1_FULL_32_8]|nr:MAG: putative toxin-antitoxin system toxin component, PIN family [Spirochaetes bacterium RIFOXYB1_FULL_32_8]